MIPRYRIEHRAIGEATLIIGFADTPIIAQSQLAVARTRLLREGVAGELVMVDQEREQDLVSHPLWTVPVPSKTGK